MIPHDQGSVLSSKSSSKLYDDLRISVMCLIVKASEKYSRPASSLHLHASNYTTTSDSFNADKDNEKAEIKTEACKRVRLAQVFRA
jgi:hypothetical protein